VKWSLNKIKEKLVFCFFVYFWEKWVTEGN
jgi:hypothetical protein